MSSPVFADPLEDQGNQKCYGQQDTGQGIDQRHGTASDHAVNLNR